MNAMTEQLRHAGIVVSANRRIWNYLLTHDEKSYDDIRKALNDKSKGITVALVDLEKRGMLASIKLPRYLNGLGVTAGVQRFVKHYSIAPGLKQKPFELLPMPKAVKPVEPPARAEPPQTVIKYPPPGGFDDEPPTTTNAPTPHRRGPKARDDKMEAVMLRVPKSVIDRLDVLAATHSELLGVDITRNQVAVGLLKKAINADKARSE